MAVHSVSNAASRFSHRCWHNFREERHASTRRCWKGVANVQCLYHHLDYLRDTRGKAAARTPSPSGLY
jgi:hypothetical protein